MEESANLLDRPLLGPHAHVANRTGFGGAGDRF